MHQPLFSLAAIQHASRLRVYLGSLASSPCRPALLRFSTQAVDSLPGYDTMPNQSGLSAESLRPSVNVHVLGAGPVGLVMAALLQSNERFSVHLYEKRGDYTRTRMVQLASYLVADSVADYCTDYI